MATKSQTKIEIISQVWEFSRSNRSILVGKGKGFYSILKSGGDKDFVFVDYKSKESLANAKVITQLLVEAVKFIEKQYENDKSLQKPSTKSRK